MTERSTVETLRPLSREEWLASRGLTVGASEAAALLGVHPFLTGYALWGVKTGAIVVDPNETLPMKRGRLLERVAVDLIVEDHPTWRVTPNVIPGGQFFRDAWAGLSATPDCFAVDPEREGFGVIQIKSVEQSRFRKDWTEDGEVSPPLYVAVQAIIEAALTGASWAAAAPLVVGFGIECPVIPVPIHAGVLQKVRAEVAGFWRMIAAGDRPDPDYGRDSGMIADLYREDNGREIDLSADNRLPMILAERAELKAGIRTAQGRVDEIETEVAAKLGAFERAYVPGWRLSRPTRERKSAWVPGITFRQLSISPIK